MTLDEYKATHLLDYDRYKIIAAVKQGNSWILIQESQQEPLHYCVQYAGNGHYFSTLEELNEYTRKRWHKTFSFNGGGRNGSEEDTGCFR